jgi:hypothetical protein
MFSLNCVYWVYSMSVSGNGAYVRRWCIESQMLIPLVASQFLMPLTKIVGPFSDA